MPTIYNFDFDYSQLRPTELFYTAQVEGLEAWSDRQWDIAAGEAYFLGEVGIARYNTVNDNTFDFWQPLAAEVSSDNHKDGFRQAVSQDVNFTDEMEVYLSGDPSQGVTRVTGSVDIVYTPVADDASLSEAEVAIGRFELPNAQQLQDARLVSINMAETVFGEGGHQYTSGYAFDYGYEVSENISHIGIDIGGHAGEAFYSPVTGTMVGYVDNGQNSYVLVQEFNSDRVWLLAHIDIDADLEQLWDDRFVTGPPIILAGSIGTPMGTLTDHRDAANRSTAHIHIAVQDMSQGSYDVSQLEYNWNIQNTNAWGQSQDVADIVESTISPLQAFYEYDTEAALEPQTTDVVSGTVVTSGGGRGGGAQDGDVYIDAISHPQVVYVGEHTTIDIIARNSGDVALDASGGFFVILSDDDILSSDDEVIAWEDAETAMAANGQLGAELDVSWADTTQTGDVYLLAGYFHNDDPITANNYLVQEVSLTDAQFSDVELASLSANLDDLAAGDTVNVSALVQNAGQITTGTSTMRLYVGHDGEWTEIASTTVVSLPGGTRTVKQLSGELPDDLDGRVELRVDIENSRDSNDANNSLTLDSFQVAPQTVDDVDDNGEVLEAGAVYDGSIDDKDDVDVFVVAVEEGGLYRVSISEDQALRMRLYDEQTGNQIYLSHADSQSHSGNYVFEPLTSGTYRIEVSSRQSYVGEFSLSVSGDVSGVPVEYSDDRDFVDPPNYVDQIYNLNGGDDVFYSGGAKDEVYGGEGQDNISGGGDKDLLYGGEDIDNLFGGGDEDDIYGGDAFDYIDGGNDNDRLFGGDGNDAIFGREGFNRLYGGAGDDRFGLDDADSTNIVDGGSGSDKVEYQDNTADMSINLETGEVSGGLAEGDTLVNIEEISSGSGNDTLTGSREDNRIRGGEGRDLIRGGDGNDYLNGENGEDTLYGGADNDWIVGGNGTDVLYGAGGDDRFSGYRIDGDLIFGGDGEDTAYFEFNWDHYTFDIADTIVTVTEISTQATVIFTDVEYFEFQDVTLARGALATGPMADIEVQQVDDGTGFGTDQDDWLVGASTADSLYGGGGDDQIFGLGNGDRISAGDGNDRVLAGAGNDYVYAGAGNDIINLGDGDDYARAGGGREIFYGGEGVDYISYYTSASAIRLDLEANTASGGWAVNDTVEGFEGVSGSRTGGDVIFGTDGANIIRTYGGNDKVFGRGGNDIVLLGDGNDFVRGGQGASRLEGGDGVDTLSYSQSDTGVRIDLRDNEASGGHAEGDSIKEFEKITGSNGGVDTLLGTDSDNTLKGLAGSDRLFGRGGDDILLGGSQSDTLKGGKGDDAFYGGSGRDTFHYDFGDDHDVIKDFQNNADTIELDGFAEGVNWRDYATQVGDDVVLTFDDGGTLTIEDTLIGHLSNDLDIV